MLHSERYDRGPTTWMGLKVITLSGRAISVCRDSCTTFQSDGEQIHGVQEGVTVTGQPLCKQEQSCILPGGGRMKVCPEMSQNATPTHEHTKESTKRAKTQTRSVLNIVPRAVSCSRSIVTMEDPLDEAAMVSGELSTLFLQLLVSLMISK